jgi:hypothetical protein
VPRVVVGIGQLDSIRRRHRRDIADSVVSDGRDRIIFSRRLGDRRQIATGVVGKVGLDPVRIGDREWAAIVVDRGDGRCVTEFIGRGVEITVGVVGIVGRVAGAAQWAVARGDEALAGIGCRPSF